jgi:hypothetical protein
LDRFGGDETSFGVQYHLVLHLRFGDDHFLGDLLEQVHFQRWFSTWMNLLDRWFRETLWLSPPEEIYIKFREELVDQ